MTGSGRSRAGPAQVEKFVPTEVRIRDMSGQREGMPESEIAALHERRKGDMTDWIPLERPVRRRGAGATSTFAVRLTPEEIMELKTAAESRGVTMSEFIRTAALERARRQETSEAALTAERAAEMKRWQVFSAVLEDIQVRLCEAQREMRAAVSEAN